MQVWPHAAPLFTNDALKNTNSQTNCQIRPPGTLCTRTLCTRSRHPGHSVANMSHLCLEGAHLVAPVAAAGFGAVASCEQRYEEWNDAK